MSFVTMPHPTSTIPLTQGDDQTIRVGATRVTLDTVVGAFLDGATPEEICYQYPSLSLADIYAVIGYYLNHQSEIDHYLAERQASAAQVRAQHEKEFPSGGIRERLLARRLSNWN
jgi:uncharacterized protein (DUF433 family)